MDDPDANALVDEYLRLISTSAALLEGEGWKDEWYTLIAEHDSESPEHTTEEAMEALLQYDVQRIAKAKEDIRKIGEIERKNKALHAQMSDIVNHRLGAMGFKASDLQDTPQGFPRLVMLSRAQAGQIRPIGVAPSPNTRYFVVEVACFFFAPDSHYKTRTLYLPESTSWVLFHRQLQYQTTNWQASTYFGCADGFTPYDGTWKYKLERQDKSLRRSAPLVTLDGPKLYEDMKTALLRPKNDGSQRRALLIHDKLREYREASMREHKRLCDRTGGTGDGAISSTGYPFDKTFDIGAVDPATLEAFLFEGHPELDRRDSKA